MLKMLTVHLPDKLSDSEVQSFFFKEKKEEVDAVPHSSHAQE